MSFDHTAIFIMLVSAAIGIANGGLREAETIYTIIAGFIGVFFMSKLLAKTSVHPVAALVSLSVFFFGIVGALSQIFDRTIFIGLRQYLYIGIFDRVFGFLLGCLRGAVVVVAFTFFLNEALPRDAIPLTIRTSQTYDLAIRAISALSVCVSQSFIE